VVTVYDLLLTFKKLCTVNTVHFVSYHFDIAIILSYLFFYIMDTGCVLCDVKTYILYVLNYSDEFLASNIRTIWFSECIGYVDE